MSVAAYCNHDRALSPEEPPAAPSMVNPRPPKVPPAKEAPPPERDKLNSEDNPMNGYARMRASNTTSVQKVLVVLALFASMLTIEALSMSTADAALSVRVVNTGGDGVSSRSAPQINARNGYGAPEGAAVVANCWGWGDAVGPYANRLWWVITYQGRNFWAPDRYLSTPNRANEPPPGQPACGSQPAPPPPSSQTLNIGRIGAPFTGRYAAYADTAAWEHWTPNGGDIGWDYYGSPGTAVHAIVASPAPGTAAPRMVVKSVTYGCGAGYRVLIDIYMGTTYLGWVSYSHLSNVPVSAGQALGFGAQIGTTNRYPYKAGCWEVSNDAGVHTHIEVRSVSKYACYVPVAKGSTMSIGQKSAFIGSPNTGPRQACANSYPYNT